MKYTIVDTEVSNLLEDMRLVYEGYVAGGNNPNGDMAEFARQSKREFRAILNNPAIRSESIAEIVRKSSRAGSHISWSELAAAELANRYYVAGTQAV